MDYEKEYKEALERAKYWERNPTVWSSDDICQKLFPELKKSEDEMIREEIINYFKCQSKEEPSRKDIHNKWIAWLEKQAEPQTYKSNADTMRKNLIKAFKSVGSKHWGGFDVRDIIHFLESKDAIELEKQSEQKSVDKVEPKFKVGDWIVYKAEAWREVLQIETIESERYTFTNGSSSSFDEEQYMRLWTIEDAKDGDVLATEYFIFIFKNIDKDNDVHYYCHYEIYKHENDNQFDIALPQSLMGEVGNSYYSPATKEQRDLLFQKMKEAGYEWDAEKKELKKVNSYCQENCKGFQETGKCFADGKRKAKRDVEQKPTWSEDDKKQLERAIYMMEQLNMTKSWDDVYNWLKSLKPQPQWKPTEEQMNLLGEVQQALLGKDCHNRFVNFMYDLKKL